ncbi:MAG: hypothetical protein WD226_02150 [Planctomycetota bacterium]
MLAGLTLVAVLFTAGDVDRLLEAGRFREADALARANGDTSEQVEVWFRAGQFRRVLAVPPEEVGRASEPLRFLHRRAAAALRAGGAVEAQTAIEALERGLATSRFDSDAEAAGWSREVQAFRRALDDRAARGAAIRTARARARWTVAAIGVAFVALFVLALGGARGHRPPAAHQRSSKPVR